MLTKEKLRNTYIKYSKDITEEVFNRIVDKLINEFGYSWYDKDTSYKDFIRLKYLKIDPYNTNQIRMCYTSYEKLITVQDILGEDWDKPKFEVGKCYYANWIWGDVGKIIFRIKEASDTDALHSGFYIFKGKYWNSGTSIDIKELSDIQETSLEEIQQYLPDDHVDKIKDIKLIKDNWYEINKGQRWIFKYDHFEKPNCIYNSQAATPHDKYIAPREDKILGHICGKPLDCKPANMEEVYLLFPEEKLISVKTAPIQKWSEGTYVVFCKNINDKKIGDIAIITQYRDDYSIDVVNYGCIIAKNREKDGHIKWFATLQEAEEFSKSLLEPQQEVMNKIAVSLPTQEKCDFFLSKFNPRKLPKDLWKKEHFIVFEHPDKDYFGTQTNDKDWLIKNNYEIITFEEWLEDNNYTFPESNDFQAIEIPEFKVGDRVEIVNSGKNYSYYDVAFKAIKFKNTTENKCINKDAGTIFHICKHPDHNTNLISINLDNGEQCLINIEGIKKISEYIPKAGDYIRYLGTKCGKIDEDWKDYFGQYGIKEYDVGKISLKDCCGYFIEEDGRPNNNGYLKKEDFTIITKEEFLRDRPFNGTASKVLVIEKMQKLQKIFNQQQKDYLISLIDKPLLPAPIIKEVKQSDKKFEFNKELKSYKFINNKKQKSYVKKEFKFSKCNSTIQTR